MTIYSHTFGPTLGLDAAHGGPTGVYVPMSNAPGKALIIEPDEIITAAGYRKLSGSEGRELYWEIANPVDIYEIFTYCGDGVGYFLTSDWYPRGATYQSWSIYSCFLDYPLKGNWLIGDNRFNLMMKVRRMVAVVELPA